MEGKKTSPVAAGAIIGLVLIVFNLIIYFTGLYLEQWVTIVAVVLMVAAIIVAIRMHGREYNNERSFGELFGFGFKVTAVMTLILILYSVLSSVLFPEIRQQAVEMARTKMLSAPGANEDIVDKQIKGFEDHYMLIIVFYSMFGQLVVGVISSLIGAAVTKKKPKSPFA